jgi:hypothetical protein
MDARAQAAQSKKRKRYEKEQANKKQKNGSSDGDDRVSRSQTKEIANLYAAPTEIVAPPHTPPSPPHPSKRRTRSGVPCCTDFGSLRHTLYNKPTPLWLLCGQCDAWDQDKAIGKKNISQGSRTYKCIAGHTSWVFPTTPLATKGFKIDRPKTLEERICRLDFEDSKEELEDTGGTALVQPRVPLFDSSTCTIEELRSTLASTEVDNDRLRAGRVKDQRRIRYLELALGRRRCDGVEDDSIKEPAASQADDAPCSPAVKSGRKNPQSQNARFQEEATRMLNKLVGDFRWGNDRVGKELTTLLFEFSDAVCHNNIIKKAKHWLRHNVFTCYNILREMDQAGGTLGYEGIEIIRAAETKGVRYQMGSLIPSVAEFKRTAAKVEKLAHFLAPFILGLTAAGDKESIDFQPYWKIMGTVFRAYGLMGMGEAYSCLCVYSLDGAAITKNLGHVLGGFKVADPSAVCPLTGNRLLSDPMEMNAQSRSLCFPLKMIMGKETKETIQEFKPMFKFMEQCESTDPLNNPMTINHAMPPLTCAANSDLSAGWKCLCKGGAAKVALLPCHGCALHKDNWARPNTEDHKLLECNWCRELHSLNPEWKCYHHSMMTPDNLKNAEAELNHLMAGLSGSLERVDNESRLQLDDVEEATPESFANPTSIHYRPGSDDNKLKYGELVTRELIIRDMSPLGTLTVKINALRKALCTEAKIRLLVTKLKHGTPAEGAMFLLIQAIPCILHMENRIGIKILTMLLVEGLSNAKAGLIYNEITAEGNRVKHFFRTVADIVNKQVLGSEDNSAEWECATDDKKKEIGTITMDNVRTRTIMDSLEFLIEECIVKEDRKAKWLACIPSFRDGMTKLRSRTDFDAAAITAFQSDIDDFFQVWVELWGVEGVTNYIHMLSSGHISMYLFKWKNLYRHSQQGWEAFNSLLKTFYFRRTQHGGRSNAGRGRKTRLLPIGRWLQRRVVWLCGYDEADIESWNRENPGAHKSGDIGGEEEEEEEEEEVDEEDEDMYGFI